MNTIRQISNEEAAVTTVEYALLLALIAGALLFSLLATGNESSTFWGNTAERIKSIPKWS